MCVVIFPSLQGKGHFRVVLAMVGGCLHTAKPTEPSYMGSGQKCVGEGRSPKQCGGSASKLCMPREGPRSMETEAAHLAPWKPSGVGEGTVPVSFAPPCPLREGPEVLGLKHRSKGVDP